MSDSGKLVVLDWETKMQALKTALIMIMKNKGGVGVDV